MNHSKTKESLFTLVMLYVTIEQNFEAIIGSENILYSSFDSANHNFKDLVDDTIHEALTYQILLKTCAYIDEWNKVFGISTDEKDKETILMIKQIAKPAYKCIYEWKELRDFRNQAIAHNHRDKNGNNIYLSKKKFNSPDTVHEVHLLVFCLFKITNLLKMYYEKEIVEMTFRFRDVVNKEKRKIMSVKEVKAKMSSIEEQIKLSMLKHSKQ